MLSLGSLESFRVVRSLLEVLLSWCSGNRSSSRDEAGNSAFHSSSDMDLGVHTKFPWGVRSLSQEAWNSAFLSKCERGVWSPVELWYESGSSQKVQSPPSGSRVICVSFELLQGNQALSRLDRDIRVFSNCGMMPGVPLEFQGETDSS